MHCHCAGIAGMFILALFLRQCKSGIYGSVGGVHMTLHELIETVRKCGPEKAAELLTLDPRGLQNMPTWFWKYLTLAVDEWLEDSHGVQ
jgi:hypothetical protein